MRVASCIVVLATLATTAHAQAPAPPPQADALGYFIGTWKSTGEDRQTPFGPAGSTSREETCEWLDGKFAVVCRGTTQGPGGTSKTISIMRYDAGTGEYTYYSVGSTGMHLDARARKDGTLWRWLTSETPMPGGPFLVRYVITPVTEREYGYQWDYAKPDMIWQGGGTGRAIRE